MESESTRQLAQGDLDGAIKSLSALLRQTPTDTTRRAQLAEALCFAGALDRADQHLEIVEQQDPSTAIGVALFRQLIRAEEARQQFYASGRVPAFVATPSEHDQMYLKALAALKEGAGAEAAHLVAEAENTRTPQAGVLDGQPFDDLRDLDDIVASHFDVLTSTGKFYWIPIRQIDSVTFHPPQRQRDLLWRRATLEVRGGPSGEVFIPAVYPPTGPPLTGTLQLAQQTDFIGDGADSPVRGRGQRSFLVSDRAQPILDIQRIEFVGAV